MKTLFIVNFEHISHFSIVSIVDLNKEMLVAEFHAAIYVASLLQCTIAESRK